MTLEQTIQESIKEAMKAKDTVAMNATRAVKGEILLFKTAEGGSKEVTDGDILKMIQKLVKQRKEAAEQYVAAGRQELADNELAEAAVMEKFLPKQLSVEEVKARIQEIIAQVGATTIKDMGKVMGAANKALAGQSDGRTISSIVKKLLGFFLIALTLTCCAPANAPKDSKTTFAKDVLQPYVDNGQLPGAISVFYKDGVQETCLAGYADVDAKRPIKMDNVFMQCSQTKGFCGVTIAKLVEEGKITLDDPVSDYLPEFKELWVLDEEKDGVKTLHKAQNVLTVRMVLNHTGGFPFEISAKRDDVRGGGWSGGAPIRQVASIAAASPLLFEPGTKESYSNTGIDIGAAVVEAVTGMKWEQYLKKEVLDPLGMKSSWFWPTDKQIKNKIELYELKQDAPAVWREEMGWQQRPYNDSHVFASAGAGLWTTASDQLKFYKMLMNLGVGDNGVRILKEETVKSILAVTTRPETMGGYSLGLTAPVEDSEDAWFGHGGAWGTNCSINWHKKELKLWVIQSAGGPQPWSTAMNEAANKFFESTAGKSAVDEYTGRIGEK